MPFLSGPPASIITAFAARDCQFGVSASPINRQSERAANGAIVESLLQSQPVATRRRLLRGLLIGLAIVVVGFTGLWVAATFVLGEVPTWTTTTKACSQPSNIDYGDGTYGVYVWKPKIVLAMGTPQSVAVVGRSGSNGDTIELHGSTDAAQLTCRWDADGVEIRESTGVTHTVPASVFTGGR